MNNIFGTASPSTVEQAPNDFDNLPIDKTSFSYRDLLSQDVWNSFDPVFGSLTVVGTPSYTGRYRLIGKLCQIQVKFSAGTSIASVAGTDYLTSPITMKGLSGIGVMTNDTTNIAVGLCHIDVTASRIYLPTQVASANVFNLFAEFEV
jgi:hypothetical protein